MPFKFNSNLKKDSHGLLGVSVGQKNQTGARFREEIEAIVSHPNLINISVFVGDSLQRFKAIARGVEPNVALEESIAAGKKWQHENSDSLELLKAKGGHIYFYEEFREKITVELDKVNRLYKDDNKFQKTVNNITDNFTRQFKREMEKDTYHHERAFNAMRSFILEESAMFVHLSNHEELFHYLLYPGDMPTPIKYACQALVNNGLLKQMRLNYSEPQEEESHDRAILAEWKKNKNVKQNERVNHSFHSSIEDPTKRDMTWIQETLNTCEFVLRLAVAKVDDETLLLIKSGLVNDLVKTIQNHVETLETAKVTPKQKVALVNDNGTKSPSLFSSQ